jgi:hypothetical protein
MCGSDKEEIMADFVGFPKMARYSREVIVTEKIDGTNAQICITEDGEFLVGSRKRWITPEKDNHGFARWAYDHKEELMGLGVGRHFGEWWGSGIQRGYGLQKGEKRFSLFNVSRWRDERPACCGIVPILWEGNFDDLDVNQIMENLHYTGSQASPGYMNPEGIVIFHTKGNVGFKKTFENDDTGKWDR